VTGDDPAAEHERLKRRASRLNTRLVEIESEFADLRRSANRAAQAEDRRRAGAGMGSVR
jgi:hypothetical protein